MFISLFNGADLKVQIIYHEMRTGNVIIPGASIERSVKCSFINVCWNWCLLWYMCINVLLNWEQLTVKLRSGFVFEREWFINMTACVGVMNHKLQAHDGILCYYKQGRGEGERLHNVVTMYNLYHEAFFQNPCSVYQICQTHADFRATFRILPCRSGFMVRGRIIINFFVFQII
jgi:hypothetical protein